jgi:hypothetical protein
MQPHRMHRATAALAAALICDCAGAPRAAAAGSPADAPDNGIWKAVVPRPGAMHGEFDNDDPIGLAAGVRIPADCSINWTDPDAGKLYCFSSATSLVLFLDAPHDYLRRARMQWRLLGGAAR